MFEKLKKWFQDTPKVTIPQELVDFATGVEDTAKTIAGKNRHLGLSVEPTDASKRTLARRTPELLYRIENEDEDSVFVKVWKSDEMKHIDGPRLAVAYIQEREGEPFKDVWVTSKETQELRSLPDDIRDFIFALDDTVRKTHKL